MIEIGASKQRKVSLLLLTLATNCDLSDRNNDSCFKTTSYERVLLSNLNGKNHKNSSFSSQFFFRIKINRKKRFEWMLQLSVAFELLFTVFF